MANNRMYIRCKQCGEILFIGKTMSDGYYLSNKNIYNDLNCFYSQHNWCSKEKNLSDINYCDTPLGINEHNDNRFEIAYEIENNKGVMRNEQRNKI
ncbi:MAG: hypothetical protein Q4E39_05160 [bacterium]|nr:hypothetical protein [bacterium]